MKNRFSKIIILIEFLLIGYLIFSLTKNVYHNYKVDQIIEAYKRDNKSMEEQIRSKTDEYLYVTSQEYVDKIAKQNLGYINTGEEVIVLASDVFSNGFVDSYDSDFLGLVELPIKTQWKNLFFGN